MYSFEMIIFSVSFPTDEESVINNYNNMLFDRKMKLISFRILECLNRLLSLAFSTLAVVMIDLLLV